MQSNTKPATFRLFLMMFLEFFIWGSWLPLIFGYLKGIGFESFDRSLILNTFSFGAITALFFSAQFADRKFSAEKFMSASHLIGGLSILALTWTHSFWPFFTLMLVHSLFYVPTISIANSIAFTHMKDAKKEFGIVRMGGTVGWIAASWPFVFILVDWAKVPKFGSVPFTDWLGEALKYGKTGDAMIQSTSSIFLVAGIASLVLAVLSLGLPHTPPKAKTGEPLAWLEAMRLLKIPYVLVLFIVTFMDAVVHNFYFSWAGPFLEQIGIASNWIMPVMSIGQIAEILTMMALGLVLKRLGWRKTMILGLLGYAIRFLVYSFAGDFKELVIAINVLHGVCYAFFFATLYIFVDEAFPKDARSSAQGLFNLLILGLGPLVAFFVSQPLQDAFTHAGKTDYHTLFLIPAGISLAATAFLAFAFRPPTEKAEGEVGH